MEQLEAVLRGPGMPRGLHAVTRAGDELRLEIDAAVTSPLLVQAIVAIEARRFGAARIRAQGSLEPAAAARVLGAAIGEPALDERRIIENHLAELEERQ